MVATKKSKIWLQQESEDGKENLQNQAVLLDLVLSGKMGNAL